MARPSSVISSSMRARLKVLDPDVSAEPGTIERKMLDTVAEEIAGAEIDQFLLSYQFDLDSKIGVDLDNFASLFGYGRLGGRRATGFVTFSRLTSADQDIIIPSGTQVIRPASAVAPAIIFSTTSTVTIYAGTTEITAPIEAREVGEMGNITSASINSLGSATSLGISNVTNETPTSGGEEIEMDAEFRIRIRNTIFRNISGTKDQFLALVIASRFSKKANVVGPISRFSEYLQVEADLSTNSQIPYAKFIHPFDYYLTDGNPGEEQFYTPISDFTLTANNAVVPATSALGAVVTTTTLTSSFTIGTSTTMALSDGTIFGSSGTVRLGTTYPQPIVTYTGKSGNTLTGCTSVGSTVFSGGATVAQGSLAINQVVLLEQTYTSLSSRNDPANNVLNAVDVFVSGQDVRNATDSLRFPTSATVANTTATSPYFRTNFLREGTTTNPTAGNRLQFLQWQPVVSLPSTVTISGVIYTEGTHYWQIRDVTAYQGSRRARDGIEWAPAVAAAVAAGTEFVMEYEFDRLPLSLNEIIDTYRQTTQDILVHSAEEKFYKVNLVVVYSPGFTPSVVDDAITKSVTAYLERQDFGAVIQFSDILSVVNPINGVDSVRISRSTDDAVNYGVQEVNSVGAIILTKTSDFALQDDQLPTLSSIYTIRRSANTWTFD